MEWITKIGEVLKLPAKVYAVVALTTGTLLFSPTWILTRLHLDTIPTPGGAVVGIVFLLSAVMTVVNCFAWLGAKHRANRRAAERSLRIFQKLEKLDSEERAILREFLVFRRSTLRLPMDKPSVVGLEASGVIRRIGALAHGTAYGFLTAYKLSDEADALITEETLGIPAYLFDGNPQLGEDGYRWIEENRPSFADDIDRFEQPRSWSRGWRI